MYLVMPRDRRRNLFSRGARLLAVKLRTRKLSQAALAALLDVSQQAVSNWLAGFARPSPGAMAALERMFGIPMRAWTELEKRPLAA